MAVYPDERLKYLREKIYDTDDKACFIERERILQELDIRLYDYYEYDREAIIFRELLERVSTPVDPMDVFAGRVLEALPDAGMEKAKRIRYRYGEEACLRDTANDTSVTFPNPLLYSFGHMCYDWDTIITKGLRGILNTIEINSVSNGDPLSALFAENSRIVIESIRAFAIRYSLAAREAGNLRAAEALERVPYEPAYDFYSALSSIWFINMISSCYEGARDFAFGRFDQYLYPFYKSDIEEGRITRDEAVDLLSYFLLKPNEICGMTAFNTERKPVPCDSSVQYLLIGGSCPNDLSIDVLRAAKRSNMAQPVVTVLWMKYQDKEFHSAIFDAMNAIAEKMQVYNFDKVTEALQKRAVPQEYINITTYSGCCSMEFSNLTTRNEYYINTPRVLCDVLGLLENSVHEYENIDEIIEKLKNICHAAFQDYIDYITRFYGKIYNKHTALLDSLFIGQCTKKCRYPGEGGALPVRLYNVFITGLSTVGDSLMVIDELVFKQKRFKFSEFMDILRADYEGNEILLAEIKSMTHFGNDVDEVDAYTVRAANALIDAIDAVNLPESTYMIGDFYSLDRSYIYGKDLPATPDGRRYGEYISENQSPSYGVAVKGATAEFRSLSKLPFDRSGGGGYNLTLSTKLNNDTLQALIESYFELGGLHVGITYVSRAELEDAIAHPEKYKSLTVRLYGYSEYFTKMPHWQQIEYLERIKD